MLLTLWIFVIHYSELYMCLGILIHGNTAFSETPIRHQTAQTPFAPKQNYPKVSYNYINKMLFEGALLRPLRSAWGHFGSGLLSKGKVSGCRSLIEGQLKVC